ncbi:hypothetical protein NRB20_38590 [Nocardia sp. RB20]|uniref:Uncharacterized protein n=1 Tax=Nocardia macrotermitis TaxID=2585198 RepID=A0A7K0D5C6_9NOCA|nr:hypothetical protein [Nocardia macrotermitis]
MSEVQARGRACRKAHSSTQCSLVLRSLIIRAKYPLVLSNSVLSR